MHDLIDRYRRHRARLSRGQSLTELALVLPVLLMLLLGALDLGRLYYAQIAITNAAREGAMMASINPTSWSAGSPCNATTNAIMCAATREGQTGLVTIDPSDVSLSCTPSCSKTYGNNVAVTVTGTFDLFTPFVGLLVGGQQLTFERTASADVVVTPAGGGGPTPTPSASPSPTPTATAVGATPTPSPSASPSPTPTPTCANPVVSFTYSQQNKNRPVNFTSTSTPTTGFCAISFWRWDFGDVLGHIDAGPPSTSHDYNAHNTPGLTFQVTLTVTTPTGTYSIILPVTTKS